ncbi:MAG: chemotaxis protein CheE [Alphaproteobacteria bacterium]|nr:chemotaxis protein CheE [Alphaproteobacteria bacterium]MBU2272180.1 chemotaxis protein CheE [Alphaproteobacteria bacterium]MBU2419389.1 chemotaxis protein CheE [Alphaproteobacteria bacterium]
MTVITHVRRKSRLAAMIDSAGGVTVGVALARARENIDGLRDKGLTEVIRHIGELAALQQPSTGEEKTESLRRIYESANHVIDAASPFGFKDLCAVAASLCDMVDRAAGETGFDWRILQVHIQSLQLLNTLPVEAAEERAAVTAQLSAMVAKKFAQAG